MFQETLFSFGFFVLSMHSIKSINTEKSKICSACGTSPVNHHFLFVSNTLEEILGRTEKLFSKLKSSFKLVRLADAVEKALHNLLALFGLVRYNSDIEKATTGRSRLVWEEAQRRGIHMEQVVVLGKYMDNYRAKINGKIFYFESLPIPPSLPQSGYSWVDDKYKLAKKLKNLGIKSPNTKKVSDLQSALHTFDEFNKPLIIKPKHGSRSRHTTTNINTKEELEKAFHLAREISPYLVMQEHLSGSVYRATTILGELVGFFRADPPQVAGDGLKNIQELITEKNKNRHASVSDIEIREELISCIKRQGYVLESIPRAGMNIDLIAKTGRMYGGYTREMLREVHPKMHQIFRQASEAIEAPVLGFDLIIEDPTKDPDNQHWGIIECNSLPFIDLHYFALEGPRINLAKNIWDLWEVDI